ncbi:MAG: Ig-like domain repeat protein [Bacteroidota bacterium]
MNGTFTPAAADIISGAATLTGSGTVQVTRTAATPDFSSQYALATATLSNLTVEYLGSGAAQTASSLTYGNLKITNASGVTLGGNVTVNGTLTLTSGTFAVAGNTLTLNGPAIAGTPSNLSTTSLSNLSFGGASTGVAIPASVSALNNLTVNNSNGVLLNSNLTVNGTLTLTSGNLAVTDPNALTLGASATTVGAKEVTGIVKRTSFVAGTTYTFGNQYASVNFANVGTLPTEMSTKVTIGSAPAWKTDAVQRTFEMIQSGASGSVATLTTHYFDAELNGNTENKLVLWGCPYPFTPGTEMEFGRSDYNVTNNWVAISGINVSQLPSGFGQMISTLGDSKLATFTWNGSASTAWTDANNWTPSGLPSDLSDIVIPDASTTPNDPTLPIGNLAVGRLTINSGGILNSGAGSTVTISGASGAWSDNGGTFNPSTSTVIFTNAAATISGATDFYNVTINSGAALAMGSGGTMRIGGTVTNNGTWRAAQLANNTVEYNGGSQTVLNPNGLTPGYDNLILSGTATKTMPGTAMDILGNFTLAGTASATAGAALTIGGDVTLGAGTAFSASTYTHYVAGNFTNNGSFTPATSTINFNGSSGTHLVNGGSSSFNNLTHSGTDSLHVVTSDLSVAGILTNSGGVLDANGKNITVGGNWTNSAAFSPGSGTVTLNGSSPQTMSGSTFNNLTVNNAAGVSLLANENVNGTLTVANGSLTTGADTVFLGSAGTLSESSGKVVVGNVRTTRTVLQSVNNSFGGLGVEINAAGAAPGSTTVTRQTGTQLSGAGGTKSIKRSFDITPSTNTGLNANFVYHYDNTDLAGEDPTTLQLFKSTDNGSTWTDEAGTVDTTGHTISQTGVNGFSKWTGADGSNVLGNTPVPTTTSINPASKTVGDAQFALTVNGTNFVRGQSTVLLNGGNRTTTFVNDTDLSATILASDLTSAVSFPITVFNAGGGGASNSQTFTVNKASTTVAVSSTLNPSVYEQSVMLKAVVSPASGSGVSPTGNVTFYDGATSLGSVSLTGDSARVSVSTLTAGSHTVKAVYGGDSNFKSDSSTLAQIVNQAGPTVALRSSLNPSTFEQNVTFTAHVDNASHTPTGNVTFYDGGSSLGTVALTGDSAQVSTSNLAGGSNTIKVVYGGDSNFKSDSTSVTQTVNQAGPAVALKSSLNPSTFELSVTFTAHVDNASHTPTGSVTFYNGGSSLGTVVLTSDSAQVSTSNLTGGSHTIKAVYGGDSNFKSDSTTIMQTVNQASSTVALKSNLNPSTFEQSVTFTAHVDNASHTPTGSVTFYDGGSSLGTVALTSDSAQMSTSNLTGGSHTIKAVYGGDSNFKSDSMTIAQTVNQASPTVALKSSLNPSTFEQSVTFTAHVDNASHTPTGSVTFYDGGSSLGTVALTSDSAQVSTANLIAGSHTIKMVYGGDSNFKSDSTTIAQTVNQASPTVALKSSLNPSTFEQSVAFTAHVDNASHTPTGSVTFYDGGSSLGTVALTGDSAQVSTANLIAGSHTIKVVYGGDANYVPDSTTLAQTVNKATPALVLTSSANPSTFEQNDTFKVHVTNSSHTPTGSVTFYDGATSLGTASLTGDSASVATAILNAGGHTIKVVYGGDANYVPDSTTLAQTVNKATPALALSSSANPSTFEQNDTFKVHVTNSSHTPTGSVTFYDGANSLGTIALTGDSAQVGTASLTGGSHTVKAVYGGDGNFRSDSATLLQTVNKKPTTSLLTSSAATTFYEQPVTFRDSVVGSIPDGGKVLFKIDSTASGDSVAINGNGVAIKTISHMTAGTHSVQTYYGGTNNFDTSRSNVVWQVVNRVATTGILSSALNPSFYGQAVMLADSVTGSPDSGTVQFKDGNNNLGLPDSINANGVAVLTLSLLNAGSHSIAAVYSGTSSLLPNTSNVVLQVVRKKPTSSILTSSRNPSIFGQSVTFRDSVTGSPVGGSVVFKDGNTSLGVAVPIDSTGVATFTAPGLLRGQHSIRALYSGTSNFTGSVSDTLIQLMNPRPTSSVLGQSSSSSLMGDTVTFVDTVRSLAVPDGGTVQFKDDASNLGNPVAIDSIGIATMLTTALSPGSHTITAEYSGTNNYTPCTSNAVVHTISDSVRYRSISAVNLTNQTDNLGKADKYVQRRPDRVYFNAQMVNDTISANGLYIEFSIGIDVGHPFVIVPAPASAAASDRAMQKWFVTFADSVRYGDTVKVYGWGVRNKLQAIARYYWRRGAARSSRDKRNAQFSVNALQLPMPNNINVLYEAYAYGGFTPTNGVLVGRARSDSAKYFGWVRMKKYTDVLKSLKDRSGVHSCTPRPFDFYTSGCSSQFNRPITREQGALPPSKQNNTLLADMIALKLNIVASALNITPVGFGELVYDDGTSTPLDGMTLGEIAANGDSLMSGYLVDSTYLRAGKPTTVKVRHFANADAFVALDSVIAKVNSAFEGPIDTVKFGDTLRLTGAKRLGEVSYLHRDPRLVPARIVPVLGNDAYANESPVAYHLYQNFPNPFNPTTTIRFDLPEPAVVTVKIYDILGQEVSLLVDRQEMDDGTQEVQFDGGRLASGVYFYRMIAEGVNDDGMKASTFVTVKKMLMIK